MGGGGGSRGIKVMGTIRCWGGRGRDGGAKRLGASVLGYERMDLENLILGRSD
jgi:hypothetical protein